MLYLTYFIKKNFNIFYEIKNVFKITFTQTTETSTIFQIYR